MKTLRELGEFGLIERIRSLVQAPAGVVSIGDDCAALPQSFLFSGANGEGYFLTSTDTVVEEVHFSVNTTDPFSLGQKALGAAISDLAACGAHPKGCLLSAQLRGEIETQWFDEFLNGFHSLAAEVECPLLGGDTVRGREISLCVTVFGVTSRRPLLRSGAKEGDDLWVSGVIGESGLGLRLLERGESEPEALIHRHRCPTPRLELGRFLLESRLATAAIDVSDGLLQDVRHLAMASGKSIVLELSKVSLAEIPLSLSSIQREELLSFGEDYELAFTAPKCARGAIESFSARNTLPLSVIGEVRSGDSALVLERRGERVRQDSLTSTGFDHFRET